MNQTTAPKQPLIWWILWFVFLMGVPQFYFFLGKQTSNPSSSLPAFIGLVPFILSGIVRWVILPRTIIGSVAFALFIAGIALAEACCFFGLFLIPAYKLELFGLSMLGILQFAPFFASKYQT